MKITNARVIVCSPGRNFVTLKIETDEGLTGIGDATLNGRELSVVSYLTEHVIPCLIGRDAHQIEDIWQYLYKGAYWRRGPVTMSAIAAVDTALWDIKAKAAGLPLYQMLGGRSRNSVMVYGHANGSDIAHTVDEVLRYKEMGYQAIRAQSGVPGLEKVYGVGKGSMFYEPADGNLPGEHDWSSEKYLLHTPKLFDAVRQAVGPDTHLLHDAHHRLTPIEAGRLGKSLEPFHLFWLEDATPAENQEAFRLIRQHTTTPLAVGEIFNTIWDCKDLIQNQLIDYIRATVVMPPASPTCGASPTSRPCTRCAPAATARPTCHRCAWAQRCTSTPGCPISACRNTCATPSRPTKSSRTPTALRRASCTAAKHRATAWRSTRSWPPNIRTSVLTCR
jgi:mannonate dehydratase